MKKIFKIIGAFLFIVSLPFIAQFIWSLLYSATSVTCLESKLGDTYNFGEALAITDKYIAVGDPKANRVAIYSYDEVKNKWSRTREIYPPKNSIIDRVGSGFGKHLVFNQDQLIIGAYSEPKTTTFDNDIEGNKYKLANEYYGAIYSLLLDKKDRSFLQEIALPDSFRLTGYSVTKFSDKIALGATDGTEPYTKPGKVLIVNPSTLQIEKIIKPPSSEQKFVDFGFVIDGNDDYLLVGSQGLTQNGGALLIDKAGKIEEISSIKDPTSPILRAGSSIALATNFVAVGNTYGIGAENTLLLSKDTKGWFLIDKVNFGGSIDAAKSYSLISTDKETSMPTSTFHSIHMLVELNRDRVKILSEIRWRWGPGHKYEAKGIIYNGRLLLSHRGQLVLLSMKYLPRNYVINRLFCMEK